MGFPCGSAGKESTCSVGDLGSTLGLGRSTEGKGYPLQYSGPENSMDCIVHGDTESDTNEWLSLHFTSSIIPDKYVGLVFSLEVLRASFVEMWSLSSKYVPGRDVRGQKRWWETQEGRKMSRKALTTRGANLKGRMCVEHLTPRQAHSRSLTDGS